ncbi:MAG: potassium channel protein [Bacteroidetes bacterium]|nr:potassium channel protein [Bacteroidota bacterium]
MDERVSAYKLLSVLLLILVPVSIGVTGYMLIENASFLDALFMTITTVATVGYGEVFPLSDAGRIFTIFLILSNLGIVVYALSLLGRFVAEGHFFEHWKLKRMKDEIARLQNHVIVCGFGRNGQAACETLRKNGLKYVVIENRMELIQHGLEDASLEFYLNEDATHDETLLHAGINNARGLITTLPDDASNVYVTLTARELNANITIISRASAPASLSKLKRAGANNVIMPDRIGGAHMASLIVLPDIKEFIDVISGQGGADVQLEEYKVEKLQKGFPGNTCRDLGIRVITGANVIGLRNPDGSYEVNPDIDRKLSPDDKLIILGSNAQMQKLRLALS